MVDDDEAHAIRVQLRGKCRLHSHSFPLFFFFFFKIFLSLYLEGPIKAPRPHLQLDLTNIEEENRCFQPILLHFIIFGLNFVPFQ